jgi:ubiquitin-conjugating enzyme E2 variant
MSAVHYELTPLRRLMSTMAVGASFLLLAAYAARVVAHLAPRHWWLVVVFAAGMAVADFMSGLVHWGADTWGRDDLPFIGHRLLVPFRVHHINPDDFLRRRFTDTNGDVALISIPVLWALSSTPLESMPGICFAVFGLGFCGVGLFTNQIHQWAHMPSPPVPIRWLQNAGVILGRAEHARHHQRPYDQRYCITTGWCNLPLESVDFFRRLERTITRLTGARPREDDRRYESRYGIPGEPAVRRG